MEPSTWLRLALTVVVLFTSSNGAPFDLDEPHDGHNDPHITPIDDWKGDVGAHEVLKDLGNINIAPPQVGKGWQPNPGDSHAGHDDETHLPDWTDHPHVSPLPVNEGWRSIQGGSQAGQVVVARGSSPVVLGAGNIQIVPELTDHSPSYGHQYPAGTGRGSNGWPSKSSSEEDDSGSKDSGSNSNSDCDSKDCDLSHSGSDSKSSSQSKSKEIGFKEWRKRSKGSGSREVRHRSKHSEDSHHGAYNHH